MTHTHDAISHALAIGDRPALLTLGHDAAVSGDAEGLARCLVGLGLAADAGVADAIVQAVAASNGRRRAKLLAVKEVLSCAARVRDGEESARYPWHEGLVWQKRTHERPFARAEGCEGGVRLTVGEEEISSYGTPHPVRVHLEVVLAAIEPPAPDAAPDAADEAAAILPLEIARKLDVLVGGGRDDYVMAHLIETLDEIEGQPCYAAAYAQVEAALALWDDRPRHAHHYRLPETLKRPHGQLLRTLYGNTSTALACKEALGEDMAAVQCLKLLDLAALDLGAQAEAHAPSVLTPFTGAELLRIGRIYDGELGLLRFPASLRRFACAGTSSATLEVLDAALSHLLADCPALEHVALSWSQRAGAWTLEAAQRLPESISLELTLLRAADEVRAAEAALGLRTVQRITSHLEVERHAALPAALGASSLLAGVRHLTLTTEPGGLAMMLRACGDALGQLETLEVELSYVEHMRFYGKKAPDCSFTAEDIDALCALQLGALRTLRLGGILAGDAGARIAAALADAGAPLHTLSLRHSRMGNKALMAFARGGLLRGLTSLDLYDVRCTGKGLAALTTTQPPEGLEVLGLGKASVGKPVAQALADWSGLSTLRRFELTDARISAENKATLLASPYLIPTSLTSLP